MESCLGGLALADLRRPFGVATACLHNVMLPCCFPDTNRKEESVPADSPLGASPVTDRSITHLWDHCASYLLCIVKCVIKGELKLKLKLKRQSQRTIAVCSATAARPSRAGVRRPC